MAAFLLLGDQAQQDELVGGTSADRNWTGAVMIGGTRGNHDRLTSTDWRWLVAQHFLQPRPYVAPEFWAATIAGVRVICVDVIAAVDSLQLEFLRANLAIAAAEGLRSIVLAHWDLYSWMGVTSDSYTTWLPYQVICEQYGVKAVFSGHTHRYHRTVPLRLSVPTAGGTVYCCVGQSFAPDFAHGYPIDGTFPSPYTAYSFTGMTPAKYQADVDVSPLLTKLVIGANIELTTYKIAAGALVEPAYDTATI
jgi:Calcineurin-like phosphoesterase